MLKEKIIIPQNIQVFFLLYNKEKYFVLKKKEIKFYCKIPQNVNFGKQKNTLLVYSLKDSFFLLGFVTLFSNFIKTVETLSKKTLLLKGLGLKISMVENVLSFKLGFSHIITLPINSKKNKFLIGKNYLSILGHNKSTIGDLVEKIYRLKKMDCYKGRGFNLKNRPFMLKVIKKT